MTHRHVRSVRLRCRLSAAAAVVAMAAGCTQPPPLDVVLVNYSSIDLEVRTLAGSREPLELPHGGVAPAYILPDGQNCLGDTLQFFDTDGQLRATIEDPCAGLHQLFNRDLAPTEDASGG